MLKGGGGGGSLQGCQFGVLKPALKGARFLKVLVKKSWASDLFLTVSCLLYGLLRH